MIVLLCYIWKELFIMGKIILHLELYPKMEKYGLMMEFQLEARVLRKVIFLQWVNDRQKH